MNLTHSIGLRDAAYFRYLDDLDEREPDEGPLPRVLTRRTKLDGAPNFNHIRYLDANRELIETYRHHLATTPARELLRNYIQNAQIFLTPSSRFTPHVIVDRLPWREWYDRVFSFPVLPALIAFAGAVWMLSVSRAGYRRPDFAADLGLLLPVLFIGLVSVVGDKGENMRFKFFLEPVLFVFIAVQALRAYRLCAAWRRRAEEQDPRPPRQPAGPGRL